jgi:hypothetical protein
VASTLGAGAEKMAVIVARPVRAEVERIEVAGGVNLLMCSHSRQIALSINYGRASSFVEAEPRVKPSV